MNETKPLFHALIAEDEPQIASIISFALETEGFVSERVSNGADAWESLQRGTFDVAVLDVMMPRVDGLEVCRRIRAHPQLAQTPILMVTARSEADEVIAGLEAGADDYVAKPFHPRELALRAAALARRAHVVPLAPLTVPISSARIAVDRERFEATLDGDVLRLTANEFRVLACFVANPGSAITWERLLAEAWGVEAWEGGREMVKAAVYRLRQKLGDDPNEPGFLMAVRGVGYRYIAR